MPFRKTISELLWSKPKLLATSNVKNLQLCLICAYAAKHVWGMWLILRNLCCIKDFSDLPPPEYEIPPGGSEIEMWNKECAFAWKQCEYHLFLDIYDFVMSSYKIFTGYYPMIWSKTGEFSTVMLPRALWFVAVDHAITNVGRFFANLFVAILVAGKLSSPEFNIQEEVDLITKPREEKVDSIDDFKDMLCVVIIYDVFGLTGIAWLVMLNQLLDVFFYQRFQFETSSYIQINKAELPGCKGIIALADRMGFFKRDLLLEVGDDAAPRATHHNFISTDIIVVTKSLLEKLPPNQSKSIVGHAMLHWKAGYCYWDHLGRFVFLGAKLYVCGILQDLPSFFSIEEEVHPAVIHALAYSVVFPVVDDIVYGFAGWVHVRQIFNIDKSIEDASSSLVYLKQALVRMADLRGSHKFDGWYSSWFFDEPSLIDRINRVRRRNS